MRYAWWGYVKDMIRRYPNGNLTLSELHAVEAAISAVKRMPGGSARLKVVDLVLWKGTHTLEGAAQIVHCSERTARRWIYKFVLETAKNFRCDGLIS
ncbi:MAG: hypothetical protein HFF77_03235 [Oscillospiraceae bacterium]|nr:hypothetical protein [Oscillospiraceae bacterium]